MLMIDCFGLLTDLLKVRILLRELFVFACNPVHHEVNATKPRVPLSAFFVSRLSLRALAHSLRYPKVSVPNPSRLGCGRNRPHGSKLGQKSLDLSGNDRQKLTTRSRTRPGSDGLRRRDFSRGFGANSRLNSLRKYGSQFTSTPKERQRIGGVQPFQVFSVQYENHDHSREPSIFA